MLPLAVVTTGLNITWGARGVGKHKVLVVATGGVAVIVVNTN